jgi:hypothetical protein
MKKRVRESPLPSENTAKESKMTENNKTPSLLNLIRDHPLSIDSINKLTPKMGRRIRRKIVGGLDLLSLRRTSEVGFDCFSFIRYFIMFCYLSNNLK